MSLIQLEGNLLHQTKGILVHQVNPDGVMGGGIALQIAQKWPKVREEYQQWLKFSGNPLGHVTFTEVEPGLTVANLFTQKSLTEPLPRTLYDKFPPALTTLAKHAQGNVIHIPYGIGSGLGGGDWSVVLPLLEFYLKNETAIVWKL